VLTFDIARSWKLDAAATAGLSVDQSVKSCASDEKARQQLAGQAFLPYLVCAESA
jgi:hypothetical protein